MMNLKRNPEASEKKKKKKKTCHAGYASRPMPANNQNKCDDSSTPKSKSIWRARIVSMLSTAPSSERTDRLRGCVCVCVHVVGGMSGE